MVIEDPRSGTLLTLIPSEVYQVAVLEIFQEAAKG